MTYHVPASDEGLGLTWTAAGFNDSSWKHGSPVVITEVNSSADDWVEIQNVSSSAVNTSGWTVAVNNSYGDINAMYSGSEWALPASLSAGAIAYRTDNSGDASHYWGMNISINNRGWVMMVTNAGEVADFVVWGYTSAQLAAMNVTVNGYHITGGSLTATSWSGAPFDSGGAIWRRCSGPVPSIRTSPEIGIRRRPLRGRRTRDCPGPFPITFPRLRASAISPPPAISR